MEEGSFSSPDLFPTLQGNDEIFFFHLRTPGGRELTILGTYEVLGIGLGALQMMSR